MLWGKRSEIFRHVALAVALLRKKEPVSCETGSSKGPVGSGMGGG